jgi:hypothetical protein
MVDYELTMISLTLTAHDLSCRIVGDTIVDY